jgi:hypothetical protein
MEPWEVRELLQVVFGYGLGFVVVISLGRTVRALIERRGANAPKELREINDRLTRIEQAVDSMAIEVERVAEAQRYTARILTDRHDIAAEPSRQLGKVVTPH